MNIRNLNEIIPRQLQSKDETEEFSIVRSVTDLLGIDSLLIHYEELSPKNRSAKPHSHTEKDEIFIFTEGTGKLIVNGKCKRVSEGDVVSFKGIDREVHVIENDSSENLLYISIATNPKTDVVKFWKNT